MDYKEILSRLLSGKNNKFPNTGMESGNSEFAIPMGTQEIYRSDLVERSAPEDELHIPGAAGVYGGGFNTLRPTDFDNEYVEPTRFDPSKLKFNQDVIDTFNPDIPERQQTIIEETINPMPMERGEGVTVSPLFGKQSLRELERQKLVQALRGY